MTTNRNLVVQNDAVLMTQNQSNDREKTSKIHLQRIREEAQLRLEIEGFVKVNCRYSTLYEGLKLNTARNSAISQPLAFMLRRFIYAVVIVFMQSAPQVGILVMIAVSTLMLNFTIFEQPWKQQGMNQLAVINELSIYVVLLLVLACESLPMMSSEYVEEIFGWVIITLIWLIIHINLVTIMAEAWHHIKLLYQYVMNYRVKKEKSKTAPVAPKIVDISVE